MFHRTILAGSLVLLLLGKRHQNSDLTQQYSVLRTESGNKLSEDRHKETQTTQDSLTSDKDRARPMAANVACPVASSLYLFFTFLFLFLRFPSPLLSFLLSFSTMLRRRWLWVRIMSQEGAVGTPVGQTDGGPRTGGRVSTS